MFRDIAFGLPAWCLPGSVGRSDDPNCVVVVDENTVLVCAGIGGLKRTTDGGRYESATLAAVFSLHLCTE